MKQTTIDTSLCPKMWIYWSTTKGEQWLNCETGRKQDYKPDLNFNYWQKTNNASAKANARKPVWAYLKYHEDIEMLEIAAIHIPTHRQEIVHEWDYAGNKYFIDKQKNVYNEGGRICNSDNSFFAYESHYAYNFPNFIANIYRLGVHTDCIKEFHKFLGSENYTVGSGRTVKAEHLWHIQEWYKRKQKVKGKGKAQLLVDKLTAIPLSDKDEICAQYPVKTITHERGSGYYRSTYTEYFTGLVYFERVDDEWSVLRIFKRNNENTWNNEVERMYLSNKGENRVCTPSTNNTWSTSKQFGDWYNNRYIFANREEAMQNSNRMKYIMPLFEADERQIKKCLINALRFPEIEQLMKMGHKTFAMSIAKSDTPKADMKNTFGDYYNEKEKNFLRRTGLNKHQFDVFMKTYDDRSTYRSTAEKTLKDVREFFGDDFIHIDNATFDDFFAAFLTINTSIYNGFAYYINRYDLDYKKFMKNIVRLGKKHGSTVYTTIRDTMNMYGNLRQGTRPEMDWYFDSYSDIVRAHDAIMELKRIQDEERNAIYNAQQAERRKKEEEKRKKLDKERKEWEYEDDNYVIRLPKDGAEIVAEGNGQRICIGGYVSDHSLGYTSLFFLRKKSDHDKPFYAIEVKDGKVIQIHGYCNRWLGNNPEAIPTVIRWLRKNNIKCTDHILTCTATGYGSTNNHCAMPKVD